MINGGGVSQIFLLKKFLTLLLGGWVRVFGVKLLNRVDKPNFFSTPPWEMRLKQTKMPLYLRLKCYQGRRKVKKSAYVFFYTPLTF